MQRCLKSGLHPQIDHILDNKYVSTNLKELNNTEYFSDQNEIKLEINNKKVTRKPSFFWKLRKYTSQRRNNRT